VQEEQDRHTCDIATGASARRGASLAGVVHGLPHHTTVSHEDPAGWRELDPLRLGDLALQRIGASWGSSVWRSRQWPHATKDRHLTPLVFLLTHTRSLNSADYARRHDLILNDALDQAASTGWRRSGKRRNMCSV
jgi:hypothetical protein